jgi:hypothetical protein
MRPEGLGNLIKFIHLIGSRTRDLQVRNSVLTTTLPRTPMKGIHYEYHKITQIFHVMPSIWTP